MLAFDPVPLCIGVSSLVGGLIAQTLWRDFQKTPSSVPILPITFRRSIWGTCFISLFALLFLGTGIFFFAIIPSHPNGAIYFWGFFALIFGGAAFLNSRSWLQVEEDSFTYKGMLKPIRVQADDIIAYRPLKDGSLAIDIRGRPDPLQVSLDFKGSSVFHACLDRWIARHGAAQ